MEPNQPQEVKTSTNYLAFGLIALFVIALLGTLIFLALNSNKKTTEEKASKPTTTSTKIEKQAQISITKTGFLPEKLSPRTLP